LYFENTAAVEEYQWLSKGLADMLITDLSGLAEIKIVERESLEKVLKEQALSLTGLTDKSSAKKVGKLLTADQLIYGTYIVNENDIRIDLKLVTVESGEILQGFSIDGDIDDLFELTADLSSQIRQRLNLSPKPVPKLADTKSIDALASFYTGLDHLDNQRYEQAKMAFSEAQELDPLFYRAQEGLAEAYKFLKAFKKHRQQREIAQLYGKINRLRERINAPQWITFVDIVQSGYYQSMSTEEQQIFNQTHDEYLICNTPTQCTWQIMLALDEISRKSGQYFSDSLMQKKLWLEIVEIGEESRKTFADDPFLPEILYAQLLALYSLPDYTRLKEFAEAFMMQYPDFRMVEAVEDFYERALQELSDD
jgi:TolB-like protein